MCGDGCNVVLAVSDYRLRSLIGCYEDQQKMMPLSAAESDFLTALNINCVLYASTMVLHAHIKTVCTDMIFLPVAQFRRTNSKVHLSSCYIIFTIYHKVTVHDFIGNFVGNSVDSPTWQHSSRNIKLST